MSIAVNATRPTFSVRRSGRAGCDHSSSQSPLLRTEKEYLLSQNYKHLASNGAKTKAYNSLFIGSGYFHSPMSRNGAQ